MKNIDFSKVREVGNSQEEGAWGCRKAEQVVINGTPASVAGDLKMRDSPLARLVLFLREN